MFDAMSLKHLLLLIGSFLLSIGTSWIVSVDPILLIPVLMIAIGTVTIFARDLIELF